MPVGELVKICAVLDVPDGGVLRVETERFPPLAVFRLDGTVYVTDDTCTHGDASLAEGELEGCVIVCPYHLGSFDIMTGEPVAAPCTEAIKVYAPIVEGGAVFLCADG